MAHSPGATLSQRGCSRCDRMLTDAAYEVRSREGRVVRCLRCVLVFGPLVARSMVICAIVGTLLVAINQGNTIIGGNASLELAWKVPLTYAVPYTVATVSAVLTSRTKAPEAQSSSPPPSGMR